MKFIRNILGKDEYMDFMYSSFYINLKKASCLFFLGPLFSFSINVIVFCPSLFFSSVIPFFLLSIMALPPAPQCIVFHFQLSPHPPPTHFFTILKSMHKKNFC